LKAVLAAAIRESPLIEKKRGCGLVRTGFQLSRHHSGKRGIFAKGKLTSAAASQKPGGLLSPFMTGCQFLCSRRFRFQRTGFSSSNQMNIFFQWDILGQFLIIADANGNFVHCLLSITNGSDNHLNNRSK
jgi:hypothetical protein